MNNDSISNNTNKRFESKKNLSLLTGLNFWNHFYGEVGVAIDKFDPYIPHPFTSVYFISNEIKFDDRLVIGPKIGYWASGGLTGLAIGFNLIYYTDFDQSSLQFRPEIGIGYGKFKVVYGYNIPLSSSNIKGINYSNIGFVYLFGIKELNTSD